MEVQQLMEGSEAAGAVACLVPFCQVPAISVLLTTQEDGQ